MNPETVTDLLRLWGFKRYSECIEYRVWPYFTVKSGTDPKSEEPHESEKSGDRWTAARRSRFSLIHRPPSGPAACRTRRPSSRAGTRTPTGHPEGYLEAFANIYRNFAADIAGELSGEPAPSYAKEYPTIKDGVRGMAFIEAVVKSSQNNAAWTELEL